MENIKLGEKVIKRIKSIESNISRQKADMNLVITTILEHENIDTENKDIKYKEGVLILTEKKDD